MLHTPKIHWSPAGIRFHCVCSCVMYNFTVQYSDEIFVGARTPHHIPHPPTKCLIIIAERAGRLQHTDADALPSIVFVFVSVCVMKHASQPKSITLNNSIWCRRGVRGLVLPQSTHITTQITRKTNTQHTHTRIHKHIDACTYNAYIRIAGLLYMQYAIIYGGHTRTRCLCIELVRINITGIIHVGSRMWNVSSSDFCTQPTIQTAT